MLQFHAGDRDRCVVEDLECKHGPGTLLPQVPTIAEAGVTGFDFPIWYGIWVPAGTPAGVVDKISKDIGQVLAGPDLRTWITNHGGEPMSMTQLEFARFVQGESESAAQLINAPGIK